MLDYYPTKTQKQLGNPDESANPTASSPACAGLAGEHCIYMWKKVPLLQTRLLERLFTARFRVEIWFVWEFSLVGTHGNQGKFFILFQC